MARKNWIWKALVFVMCLSVVAALTACAGTKSNFGKLIGKDEAEEKGYEGPVGTLGEIGVQKSILAEGYEIQKLEDIYFPNGLLETGLGLYLWKNNTWVRTDKCHGSLDEGKDVIIYIHGMGGNGTMGRPEYFEALGYNVLSFMWGTYACESIYTEIVNKIYYREDGAWARDVNNDWETEDIAGATIAETFLAFYYDLMEYCPNYHGSNIHILSFSYGGSVLGAFNSLITACYTAGKVPAYMLHDTITMMDPFFSRTLKKGSKYSLVPWLGENSPADGNMNEAIYQGMQVGRELGVTYRMFRASDPVAMPGYLPQFGEDVSMSYWKMVNSMVYAHLDADSSDYMKGIFAGEYLNHLHQIGYDWVLGYYKPMNFYDTNAKLSEEVAFSFDMAYDISFARCGAKYSVNLNGTLSDISDDTVTSSNIKTVEDAFEGDNSITKAKICGFVYVDENGNGELDDRLASHFAGAEVIITSKDGKVIGKQYTGLNGYYELEVDEVGEYMVTVKLPDGYSADKLSAEVSIVDAKLQCTVNNFGINK